MRVFLSYRRTDSPGHAGRIYDRLSRELGAENVFMDVDTLEPGEDFVDRIESVLAQCDALVAVIGPEWLKDNADRLARPEDFIRLEITTALRRGVRVVPVLVDGGTMPDAAELPEALRPLTRRNALRIDDTSWSYGCGRLARALVGRTDPSPDLGAPRVAAGDGRPRRPRRSDWRITAGIGVVVLLALGGVLWAVLSGGQAEGARDPIASVPATTTPVRIAGVDYDVVDTRDNDGVRRRNRPVEADDDGRGPLEGEHVIIACYTRGAPATGGGWFAKLDDGNFVPVRYLSYSRDNRLDDVPMC